MTIHLLKPALKRHEAEAIASIWLDNKLEIQNFLSHFDKHSLVAKRKGMWILGIIHEMAGNSLDSFHDVIFKIFSKSSDPAVRREIFQILSRTPNEKIRGAMLDEALKCILNPLSSVAECHHALQSLMEPSMKHPEIAQETIHALTKTLDMRTTAWSRYGSKKIALMQRSCKR